MNSQRTAASQAATDRLPLGQILLLSALTATLPASIDGLSPALPAVATALATEASHMPAAMSAFVISFAVAQLLGGMLADALGRRPVVLAGLIIYTAAGLLCAIVDSFVLLLAARALQGVGAAAAVLLARTIVRDQLPREAAARALALIGVFFALTPILAPVLSGALVSSVGWRAPFVAMAGLGAVVGVVSFYRLPETLSAERRLSLDFAGLMRSLGHLARSPALMGYVLTNAFAYSGILLFSAAAPQAVIGHMGVSAATYAVVFALSTGGFMAGNALSFRLVHRLGVDRTMRMGVIFQCLAPLLMYATTKIWPGQWEALILPQMLYSFGWGIVQPQTQAGALSTHPESIGQASALLGFCQLAIAGVIVALFSRVTDGMPQSLSLGMAFCGTVALLAGWLLAGRLND